MMAIMAVTVMTIQNGGPRNRGQRVYRPAPSNRTKQDSRNSKVQVDKYSAHLDNDDDLNARGGRAGNAPGRTSPFPPMICRAAIALSTGIAPAA